MPDNRRLKQCGKAANSLVKNFIYKTEEQKLMQPSRVKSLAFFFFPPNGRNLWACVSRQKGTKEKERIKILKGKYWRSEENGHMDRKKYGKGDRFAQFRRKAESTGIEANI